MFATIALIAFPLLLIFAALKDAATMTIPNWISIALSVVFVVVAPFVLSPQEIGIHLAVGFVAFFIGVAMFALNWVGGGDAKLFAAAALWMGWDGSLMYIMAVCLAGGALTLGILLARRFPWPPTILTADYTRNLLKQGGAVPYGIALCIGALMTFPHTQIFMKSVV